MKKITNAEKNSAKMERRKLKLESGQISEHYPEIASIALEIKNSYGKKNPITITRDLKFLPESPAYFTIECLNKNCADGGFDMSKVIIGMISNRKQTGEGELHCYGKTLPSDHSHISYRITITYNK